MRQKRAKEVEDGFGESWDEQNEMESYEGDYLHETDLALLFLPDGWDEDDAIWLPKSMIQYEEDEYDRGDQIIVEIPNWLAEEKELI